MSSPEFEEILASLQSVVRRAYALGRSEALKKVVEVMQSDESSWRPLALAAPVEGEAEAHAAPADPVAAAAATMPPTEEPDGPPVPWWMQPSRPGGPKRRAANG